MAEADEPKKETTRISLPPRRGDVAGPQDDDTVRINLPARPPTSEPPPTSAPLVPPPGNVPIPRPPISQSPIPKPPMPGATVPRTVPPSPPPVATTPPPVPPAAKTPLPPRPMGAAAAAAPGAAAAPAAAPPPASTLTKETARISILPDPPKPAPVKMSKTQPLITATATPVTPLTAPVKIAPAATPQPIIESIPMSLCWGLVLVSAAVLIIEIWNYIS
jgi:hypothetical protein